MTLDRIKKVLASDRLYLFAWSCWLAIRVIGETAIELGPFGRVLKLVQLLMLVAALAHGLTTPSVRHTVRSELAWLAGIALFCVSGLISRNYVLAQAVVLVYGSRGVRKDVLLKQTLWIIVAICAFTVLLSQVGLVQNIIVETRSDRVRSCLGFLWPSRLPNFLFTVLMLVMVVGKGRMSVPAHVAFTALAGLLYLATKTRGPLLATVLLLAFSVVLQIWPRLELPRWARALAEWVHPLCAALTLVPSLLYNHSIGWMHQLNYLSSNRLIYSHNALMQGGITLLGSPAFDDATVSDRLAGYLDAAYLRLLCSMGVIAFVVFLFALVLLTSYALRKKDRALVACLAAVAIHSTLEGNLLWIQYTPILLILSDAVDEALGVAVEKNSPTPSTVLFAVCTPFQLFSALCLRLNTSVCSEDSTYDLMVSPNFPNANRYVSELAKSGLFERVFVFAAYEGTYFPQVKDFAAYLLHPKQKCEGFLARWPQSDRRYDAIYTADPNAIIDVRLYAASEDVEVYLFDEGAGSYNGSMASSFCIQNCALDVRRLSFGTRASVKFWLKDIANVVDITSRYQFVPSAIYLFNVSESVGRVYTGCELRHNELADIASLEEACPSLSTKGDDAYRTAGLVFFASWDDAMTVEQQLDLAQRIGQKLNCSVVFRPHPRSLVEGLHAEGVAIDASGNLWELICLKQHVPTDAVLAGFSSTAQIMPKILCGTEPPLLLLANLMNDSVPYKRRLVSAGAQFRDMYEDQSRTLILTSQAEIDTACDALANLANGEVTGLER